MPIPAKILYAHFSQNLVTGGRKAIMAQCLHDALHIEYYMHGAIDHQKQPSGSNHYFNDMYTSYYHVVQMFDRENFNKFDESKLYHQNFPLNILQLN